MIHEVSAIEHWQREQVQHRQAQRDLAQVVEERRKAGTRGLARIFGNRQRPTEILDRGFADQWEDTSHDEHLRAETAVALERTGKDVGTPIITFRAGQPDASSFFGPVIARIPRGDEALRLWDAVEVIATTSGMAELKRSLRDRPRFD